ncbi:MAG: S41 family peptidase [Prevotella sp.]|nr:S41 family peptidase [Prevotella sp.]
MVQRCNTWRHTHIVTLLLSLMLLSSCVDVEEYDNSASGNFEALWHIMDENYCFFTEKGVDWDAIHDEYAAQVKSSMSRSQLFEFLAGMLSTLRDGHVNLSTSFDYSRSWSWKEDYPENFSHSVQRKYLGNSTDYKISSGIYYKILDDNIAYMYIGSFDDEIGSGNLDEILMYFASCNGLIIDVRSNGGGKLTEAQKVAARFISKDTLVGYMRHKVGKGHDDLGDWEETVIKTSSGIRWTEKPVCVLTNRSVYSSANEFVKYMKAIGATTIGDTTGGGSGMPYSNELPNGWSIRMSACPMYDKDKQCTEFGIEPDIKVDMSDESMAQGIDDIIETARYELTTDN